MNFNITVLKIEQKILEMEKNTGKFREIGESDNVGTMHTIALFVTKK